MADEQRTHAGRVEGVGDQQQVGLACGVGRRVVVDETQQALVEDDVVATCGQVDPGVLASGQSGKGQGFLLGNGM
ncbi:hypothetical protein [Microbacterium oleivorans]|uniref:hypothetical protein n=1 Tax=Microbacterium oleivorans TaxID=273677 RepID=UPI002116B91F|nr:hypothetical protein [Microbacterium oleivorans]